MVRRKLQALGYEYASNFDIDDADQFRAVVLWLEDQIIRHYKIDDRAGLRNIKANNWPEHFEKYCKVLSCPVDFSDHKECMEWICGFAVRLEYFDNKEKYSKQISDNLDTKIDEPVVKSTNPLDKLDFQSDEFKKGVNDLATLLKITPHPNHLITLEAVCTTVVKSLSTGSTKCEGAAFPVAESDLGFDIGDYVLNHAAKILRLLYIHDLRDLQTKINECIVAVQKITANPKTDTTLGKVGY